MVKFSQFIHLFSTYWSFGVATVKAVIIISSTLITFTLSPWQQISHSSSSIRSSRAHVNSPKCSHCSGGGRQVRDWTLKSLHSQLKGYAGPLGSSCLQYILSSTVTHFCPLGSKDFLIHNTFQKTFTHKCPLNTPLHFLQCPYHSIISVFSSVTYVFVTDIISLCL